MIAKKWCFGRSLELRAVNKDKASYGSSVGTVVVDSSTVRNKILKRVLVFGDSNSFRPDGGNQCWAALLGDRAPDQLDVVNESCDARTTQYDVGELNGLDVIEEKLIAHAPLNYVILMLGTNDLKNKYGPPDAVDVAIGASHILDVIGAQNSSIKPIIVTPPPLGNVTSGDLAGAQSRVPLVAVEYRLLAMNRDIRLIDVHAILDSSRHYTDLIAWSRIQTFWMLYPNFGEQVPFFMPIPCPGWWKTSSKVKSI